MDKKTLAIGLAIGLVVIYVRNEYRKADYAEAKAATAAKQEAKPVTAKSIESVEKQEGDFALACPPLEDSREPMIIIHSKEASELAGKQIDEIMRPLMFFRNASTTKDYCFRSASSPWKDDSELKIEDGTVYGQGAAGTCGMYVSYSSVMTIDRTTLRMWNEIRMNRNPIRQLDYGTCKVIDFQAAKRDLATAVAQGAKLKQQDKAAKQAADELRLSKRQI
jgi:hypothetical protein